MKRIGIICGGFSSEYEISVKSATTILRSLPEGYIGYLIYLDRSGWSIELEGHKCPFDQDSFEFDLNDERVKIDFAIVYIHGDPGENGKVQAFLDMKKISYINSGPLASHLSFDKWYCNQFLKGFGISVAESVYLSGEDEHINAEQTVTTLGLPIFVKPCDSGSSFGISRVNEKKQLKPAIKAAFKQGRTVVLESFLNGTEVTCGVYRSAKGITTLPLTEIASQNEFFDFEAKYNGRSEEITPARIDDQVEGKIIDTAKKIYGLLGLRSIARIDFMIVDNQPHVIEVNTTPGFSEESIVPKMIRAANKTIPMFWAEIFAVELGQREAI